MNRFVAQIISENPAIRDTPSLEVAMSMPTAELLVELAGLEAFRQKLQRGQRTILPSKRGIVPGHPQRQKRGVNWNRGDWNHAVVGTDRVCDNWGEFLAERERHNVPSLGSIDGSPLQTPHHRYVPDLALASHLSFPVHAKNEIALFNNPRVNLPSNRQAQRAQIRSLDKINRCHQHGKLPLLILRSGLGNMLNHCIQNGRQIRTTLAS